MDKEEKKLKLYHGQICALIKSLEGKNLAGKVFKNNEKVRKGWFCAAEDILLKMIDIDADSTYVTSIREKLYGTATN